ncbi:MAG: carboxynorspermidine decarboxylase, partial [Candidatus Margulisiibacteriota bacterium]|nr:carboxynorspermidine decarboxylase [Candidatus Margulisiibacteriota bacterium]
TDLSVTAHMPDVLEYPYTPEVYTSNNKHTNTYYIGGNTCLAGDYIGPYSFAEEKKIGDFLIFLDMGHYTIVKTSNFNGVKQPSIGKIDSEGNIKLISNSCYFNFKERLS